MRSKAKLPETQTPLRACVTGKVSLLLTALLYAVVDGLTAFLLGAFFLVPRPARRFASHQIPKAAISTGVAGR